MGVLAQAETKAFFLRAADVEAATEALRAMAARDPDEFLSPSAATGAASFDEVLLAAGWRAARDAGGNVIGLKFAADKAPREADDLWPVPMFRTLAPFVPAAIVDVRFDGAPATYVLLGTMLQQWHGPPRDADERRTRAAIRKTAQRMVKAATDRGRSP